MTGQDKSWWWPNQSDCHYNDCVPHLDICTTDRPSSGKKIGTAISQKTKLDNWNKWKSSEIGILIRSERYESIINCRCLARDGCPKRFSRKSFRAQQQQERGQRRRSSDCVNESMMINRDSDRIFSGPKWTFRNEFSGSHSSDWLAGCWSTQFRKWNCQRSILGGK